MLQPAGLGSCSFTFQFNFLYFLNTLWKSALSKKAPEDIDDGPGSWDSQVHFQNKGCSGWQKLHQSPGNLSLGLSFLPVLLSLGVRGSPALWISWKSFGGSKGSFLFCSISLGLN